MILVLSSEDGGESLGVGRRDGVHADGHLHERQPERPDVGLDWVVCALETLRLG